MVGKQSLGLLAIYVGFLLLSVRLLSILKCGAMPCRSRDDFFFLKRPFWKLIVIYLFEKFPAFMKSKIPLFYSQERGIGPDTPPAESSLQRI